MLFILPFFSSFHNDKSQQYFYQSEKFTDGTYFVHASVWLWLFRYQLRTHELVYICIQQWLFLSTKQFVETNPHICLLKRKRPKSSSHVSTNVLLHVQLDCIKILDLSPVQDNVELVECFTWFCSSTMVSTFGLVVFCCFGDGTQVVYKCWHNHTTSVVAGWFVVSTLLWLRLVCNRCDKRRSTLYR